MEKPAHYRLRCLLVCFITGVFCAALSLSFSHLAHSELTSFAFNSQLGIFLPLFGVAGIALMEHFASAHKKVGLAAMVASYHYHNGELPLKGLLYQWVVCLLLVWSGFAIGIVGPCCYLAGCLASFLSRKAFLRARHQRLFLACGSASAVAALFNAPFAATVLAYELLIKRFSWRDLSYVALCALSASLLSDYMGGSMLKVNIAPLEHMPGPLYVFVVLGIVCGLLAGLMVAIVRWAPRLPRHYALLLVGLLTSLAAWYQPQWLGLEPITPNELIAWRLSFDEMHLWLIARIVLSGLALAMMLPGGSVGPMLVIGGICGALFAHFNLSPNNDVMVVVGMAAMLGAVFRSPWAAFLLLSEQTMQVELFLPMITACLSASFVTQYALRSPSLLDVQLLKAGYTPCPSRFFGPLRPPSA